MQQKRPFFQLFLLIFLVNFSSLFAQQKDFRIVKDESFFKDKIAKIAQTTKTISSDFVQEKHLSFMEEGIISSGKFFYKKDKKVRWEYQRPFNYLVILNGSELLIDDEGHKNEIDLKGNKTYQQINQTISSSLQGNVWEGQKDFSPVLMENSTHYLIVLSPLTNQMKDYLTKIEVFFDKKSFQLDKVIMREPGNDWTQIQFTNRKINEPISDANFNL